MENQFTSPNKEIFAIQVASTHGHGGIITSIKHYTSMFSHNDIENIVVYRGPASTSLKNMNVQQFALPYRSLRQLDIVIPLWELKRKILRISNTKKMLVIIHSDLALPAFRRMLPNAIFAVICHTENIKPKRKKLADIVITLQHDQYKRAILEFENSSAIVSHIGNPYCITEKILPEPDSVPKNLLQSNISLSNQAARIVFCGRFEDVKNPIAIIEAHKKMKTSIELLMIGDGSQLEFLKKSARSNVNFVGWQKDPWKIVKSSDILVLPSKMEGGTPYILLEAMNRGVPIIASDIPGNREALNNGLHGDLFPLGNLHSLVRKLTNFFDNPRSLYEKSIQGQQCLNSRFGPIVFWDRLLSTIKQTEKWKQFGMSTDF